MLELLLFSRRDERGASATEYGLLAAAIAALVVAILFALGGATVELYDSTCETVASETSVSASC